MKTNPSYCTVMASPISIGDALLLSKIAYKLAHTIATDRKGVPNAVKEIRNQLLAIGNALSFGCFQRRGQGDESDGEIPTDFCEGDVRLTEMIANCKASLQKLERLVKKYTPLAEDDTPNTSSFFRKAAKNLRWIQFLLDDSEFQTVKRDLALHVEAITLALCARNE